VQTGQEGSCKQQQVIYEIAGTPNSATYTSFYLYMVEDAFQKLQEEAGPT
jgi:ABC-type phosphate transport system substrate-binding protein